MPVMTGVELTRQLRALKNPVYIVGCTGNALREDQEEYLLAGADRVLTKPIKQEAIASAIEDVRERIRMSNARR
jgi:CheY-like chemotaxis protein